MDEAALKAFWNARYEVEGYAYGTAPNGFLMQCTPRLPPRGRVLCLGDGEGRNGVWLAQQGHDVTSVDIADAGLRKAQDLARRAAVPLHTVQADVTAYDVGRQAWDAIVSIFLHLPADLRRALHARCVQALKPGGAFVYEAYTVQQLRFGSGGPKERELLVTPDQLEAEFPGCTLEHLWSGEREVVEGRLHTGAAHVVQLLARKP